MGIGTGTAALIGGVASAGAGLAGSAMQASAAGNAAQAQQQAAQQGMNIAQQNLQSATGAQQSATGQIQAAYQPFLQGGQMGAGLLSQMLKPGGTLSQDWTGQFAAPAPFQAPTAEQAAATPGYQFALQQGEQAMQRSAAASGNLLTGGTQKALANYAQGLASTTYQQTYQNAFNQYNQNYNNAFNQYLQNYQQFQQNQANQYNRLMGLTGLGAQMTGQYGQATQAGAGNLANIYNANTASMANLLGAKGTAQASGAMGQANAWSQGIGNIGGTAMQLGMMPYLQQSYGPQTQPQLASQADLQTQMNTTSPFGQSLSTGYNAPQYAMPGNMNIYAGSTGNLASMAQPYSGLGSTSYGTPGANYPLSTNYDPYSLYGG